CVCNTAAGDVISREGKGIVAMKTMPVPYSRQIACKAAVALAVAAVSDLFTVLVLVLRGRLSVLHGLMIFAIAFSATAASVLNLLSRDIDSPAARVGENANVTFAIIKSLILSVFLGGLCLVLRGVDVFYGYTGGDNAFLRGIYSFTREIGGIYGIMGIALVVCIALAAASFFRLKRDLEGRMRRIAV
ncbi:MAG: hypothetical protein J6126_00695, partial [Clostridia bacterium]|nr:hypothetical protein [Clostridia bacterium]